MLLHNQLSQTHSFNLVMSKPRSAAPIARPWSEMLTRDKGASAGVPFVSFCPFVQIQAMNCCCCLYSALPLWITQPSRESLTSDGFLQRKYSRWKSRETFGGLLHPVKEGFPLGLFDPQVYVQCHWLKVSWNSSNKNEKSGKPCKKKLSRLKHFVKSAHIIFRIFL